MFSDCWGGVMYGSVDDSVDIGADGKDGDNVCICLIEAVKSNWQLET